MPSIFTTAAGGAVVSPWTDPNYAATFNPNGYPIDANGNLVYPWQQSYQTVAGILPNGGSFADWAKNPFYGSGSGSTPSQTPTPVAPQYRFTFDTIGQSIYRSIGHCMLPLRIIWAQGINASGDTTTSPTLSFAAALCAPLDPNEEGEIGAIYNGSTLLYDPTQGGVVIPDGTDATNAALLQAALNNAIIYPGDEAQLPAPLISADKGSNVTNAFRGLRYIIFPNFPLALGTPSSLSVVWQRTNTLGSYISAAVEFAAGTA
jgi:hypothetical protein